MGSAMLMGERVQRRESCDARRSEVGAYLYKTVMCVKSSCVLGVCRAVPACGAPVRGHSRASGPVTVERTEPIRRAPYDVKTSGLDSHGGK